MRGQASDIKIHADWIVKTKQKLNQIYVDRTGQPYEKIERDTDRDNFMSAEDAVQYGLVDRVINAPVAPDKA
ncbi:ATP-dependent Clp protease proteolytic subunit [compost metagenome]